MKIIHLSVVSHEQGKLVDKLLSDLNSISWPQKTKVIVTVTLNCTEDYKFRKDYKFCCRIIRNLRPLGFGANHNQAFSQVDSDFFVVLNPDLEIDSDFNIEILLQELHSNVGCVGPLVLSKKGEIEDSARRYPSFWRILKRTVFRSKKSDYDVSNFCDVDWLGGMFLLFNSSVFRDINGFDIRFFMYLEDADICRRLNKKHYAVRWVGNLKVVHDARRQTGKDLRHTVWHIRSMVRFLYGI